MTELAEYLKSKLTIDGLEKVLEKQILILAGENAKFRQALEMIDTVAVSKKAGAAKQMQAIARGALGVTNGDRQCP